MALFILLPLIVNSGTTASSPHFLCSFHHASFTPMPSLILSHITRQKENSDGFNAVESRHSSAHTHYVIIQDASVTVVPSTLMTTNLVENRTLVSAGKRK